MIKVLGQIITNVIPRANAVFKMSQLRISYILIIKFSETLIILSTDLETTIDHQTLTDGDAALSDGTFLPSNTITDSELQEKEKKSLKFLAFHIFEKFN